MSSILNVSLRQRVLPLAALTGVLAVAGTQAGGAAPVERPLAASDTVRGVVYDSVANIPLADAFVAAEPAGVSVSTDSLGRFTLVADTRIDRITVYHRALDEIGFGALVADRPDAASSWSDVTIAIPSMETVWTTVCGEARPTGENGGVLIGTTRLADNRTYVGGAGIRVQWEAILPRTRQLQLQELDAVSDSSGAYALCGVPNVGEMAMIALSTELGSGAVRVSLTDRPLRRINLVMAKADGPIAEWPTIVGQVIGPDLEPVPGATVGIDGRDSTVTADSVGRFTLSQVPPGSRMLAVEAPGFVSGLQQVDVLLTDNPEVMAPLDRGLSIAGLEGFTVTERRVLRRDREEFEVRRREGMAVFVDTVQFREAGSLRAALSLVPGLEVADAPNQADSSKFVLIGRGRNLGLTGCQVNLLVDGVPATLEELHAISVEQFAAVEVYRSEAYAPPRFGQFAESDCALVIFWTQFGLRP